MHFDGSVGERYQLAQQPLIRWLQLEGMQPQPCASVRTLLNARAVADEAHAATLQRTRR